MKKKNVNLCMKNIDFEKHALTMYTIEKFFYNSIICYSSQLKLFYIF